MVNGRVNIEASEDDYKNSLDKFETELKKVTEEMEKYDALDFNKEKFKKILEAFKGMITASDMEGMKNKFRIVNESTKIKGAEKHH